MREEDMGPKDVLARRRLEALSPYDKEAWARELGKHGLQGRYPSLIRGLAEGFRLGIPQILRTHLPPNHPSISTLLGLIVGPGPYRLPAGIPVGIPAGNLTHGSGSH